MEKWENNIRIQLLNKRFREIETMQNNKLQNYYIREENPVLYIVGIFENDDYEYRRELLWEYANGIFSKMGDKIFAEVIAVAVVLGEKPEHTEKITSDNEHIHYIQWYFDLDKKKVFAEDGQPDRLIGLEKMLIDAVENKGVEGVQFIKPSSRNGLPIICCSIFLICLIMLLYTMGNSDPRFAYTEFGISRNVTITNEYYRFITSMFVHDGWSHLISNTIYLYYFGGRLEQLFGSMKFCVIYLFSGLTGSLLSMIFSESISVGASGCTYGLLGAMLMVAKKYGGRYIDMSYSTLIMLGFISITSGFFRYNVNNIAHMGGILCGMYFGNYFIEIAPKITIYPQNGVEK